MSTDMEERAKSEEPLTLVAVGVDTDRLLKAYDELCARCFADPSYPLPAGYTR